MTRKTVTQTTVTQPTQPECDRPANRLLTALVFGALVAGWTLLTFLPSLEGGFLNWDDPQTVVENTHVHGLDAENVGWAFSSFYMGHYQPLTWISYAVDYSVWGPGPFGFRWTNLLLHVATSVLLLFVCRRLLMILGWDGDHVATWLAPLAGALFFAVHPLRVESVAWITERRDVLCGFFVVAATLAYLPRARGLLDRRRLLLSVVLFVLSLLSKASTIAFPAVLVLLDLAVERRVRWLSKIPFVVAALPFVFLAPMAQESTRAAISFDLLSVTDRLWNAVYGLAFYLSRTVWPAGLSALHELPHPLGTRDGRYVRAVVALSLVVLLLWVLRRVRPEWARALALTFAASAAFLLPVLGFFQSGPQLVAGRYTYVAALPVSLVLTVALCRAPRTAWIRRAGVGLSALALTCLTIVSYDATRTWRTDDELWTRAVEVDPACALCNAKLGHVRLAQGRTKQAEALFKAGLEKLPLMTDSAWALVKIYRTERRWDESLPLLNGLVRRNPGVESNWREMARALWFSGRLGRLADLLQRLPPDFAEAPWARDTRRALAAVLGLEAAAPPRTSEELDAVATLLAEADRCLPVDTVAAAPEWIRRVHALCREAVSRDQSQELYSTSDSAVISGPAGVE